MRLRSDILDLFDFDPVDGQQPDLIRHARSPGQQSADEPTADSVGVTTELCEAVEAEVRVDF